MSDKKPSFWMEPMEAYELAIEALKEKEKQAAQAGDFEQVKKYRRGLLTLTWLKNYIRIKAEKKPKLPDIKTIWPG